MAVRKPNKNVEMSTKGGVFKNGKIYCSIPTWSSLFDYKSFYLVELVKRSNSKKQTGILLRDIVIDISDKGCKRRYRFATEEECLAISDSITAKSRVDAYYARLWYDSVDIEFPLEISVAIPNSHSKVVYATPFNPDLVVD